MPSYRIIEPKQTVMGKLVYGGDLLKELTVVCEQENILLGTIKAIGAVQKACLGYYDQHKQKYQFTEIEKRLEIASLIGNISVKDNKPMVHAHVTLADDKNVCYAGHLAEGTIVFACEFLITVCEGTRLVRDKDEKTGLHLWKL